jgi:outer membrane protein assembly factor BamA
VSFSFRSLIYLVLTVLLVTFSAIAAQAAEPPAPEQDPSKFVSADDGWFDASEFLDQAYGFVPVAFPITEPAVGYGAGVGLLFVDRDKAKVDSRPGYGRPNLTAVGGLSTENGTWGVFAADSRYWLNDRLQTLTAGVYASVNLDFYGIGSDSRLRDNPLRYNLEPRGGVLHSKYRLGSTPFSVGLGYAFAVTEVTFDASASDSRLPDIGRVSRVGGATLSITYDTRDNIFTPKTGTYIDVSGGVFSPTLGSDGEFQRGGLTVIQYFPFNADWSFGVLGNASFSAGDVPFYMRPYVTLRGVEAMRYQGEETAQIEAEVRWQCWNRFSIVAFGGSGVAWNDRERMDNSVTVNAGGLGFRYELARKYGLHMGLDVAYGPDGAAVYVQVGSAWIRP